jgi:hypothetical protein
MNDPKPAATPLHSGAGVSGPGAAIPAGPQPPAPVDPRVPELGGPKGLEPTRYGDWERDGRCVDF